MINSLSSPQKGTDEDIFLVQELVNVLRITMKDAIVLPAHLMRGL